MGSVLIFVYILLSLSNNELQIRSITPFLLRLCSSRIFSSDHLEHFFNQLTELCKTDSIIAILIDQIQNVVNFLPRRAIHTDFLSDLNKHLFELSPLEILRSVDVHLTEGVLHEFLKAFGIA